MIIRVGISIVICLAIFFVPWWSIGVAGIIAAIQFRHYYELIIIGYLLDLVYMGAATQYMFTLVSIGIVGIMIAVHSYVRSV